MRHTLRKTDKRTGAPLVVDDTELALFNVIAYALTKLREEGVRMPPLMLDLFRQAHKDARAGYVDLPAPPEQFTSASYLDDAKHQRTMYLVAEHALWAAALAGDDAGAQESCEDLAERVESARTEIERTIVRLEKSAAREAKQAAKRAARKSTVKRSA